ncbi:hypothetical protein BDI4_20079 [Burkholderia diffusa]|nr:hypothetical protein BDI4_20079 [Burkholderia diffusa]
MNWSSNAPPCRVARLSDPKRSVYCTLNGLTNWRGVKGLV